MKIDKRDWTFLVLIVAVLGIIFCVSGKVKTTPVPNNQMHKIVYDVAFQNAPGSDDSTLMMPLSAKCRPDMVASKRDVGIYR